MVQLLRHGADREDRSSIASRSTRPVRVAISGDVSSRLRSLPVRVRPGRTRADRGQASARFPGSFSLAGPVGTGIAAVIVLLGTAAAGLAAEPQQRYALQVGGTAGPAGPASAAPDVELRQPSETDAYRTPVDFRGARIQGGSIYAESEIAEIYQELIGKRVKLSDVYRVARDIQRKYRDDGYLLTRCVLPEQKVVDGIFEFRIVEGFISTVRIEGNAGRLEDRIQRYMDEVRALRPVNSRELERYLLFVNDMAGISARGVLRPDKSLPGASELVLRVERKPFEGIALANNRGSEFTGRERAMVIARANSVLGFGERLELLALSSFDREQQQYGRLIYQQPLGTGGLTLGLLASYGPSEPTSTLATLGLQTRTARAEFWLDWPILRSRNRNLNLTVGFDAIDSDVELLDTDFSNDSLRVLRAGARYEFTDRLGGDSQLSVEVRRGLTSLGASANDDPDRSRLAGKSDFTSVNGNGDRYQRLFGPLGIYFAFKWQYAFDTLLADEECLVGGEYFGRGNEPGTLAGEHCIASIVELQWHRTTNFQAFRDFTIYGFYDGGIVWNDDTGADVRSSLTSAGLGLRAHVFEKLALGLEVAKPLTRMSASESDRDPEFYVQLSAQF